MSMLATLISAGGAVPRLYSDDVFSAYTYTGNGSTQTITNGIDLAGKGGMVWTKNRTNAYGANLYDTATGVGKYLIPSSTQPTQVDALTLTSFNSNGFTCAQNDNANFSGSSVAWTFRKAPKFFDVVTYTGTGVAGLTVNHSLGIKPGMIIVKRTDTTGQWGVYHQSIGAANALVLNSTQASGGASYWNSTEPTATQFTLGAPASDANASGGTYVAYLFAHDPSADGIVQCGSFTTDGSGNATVNLGWEPQYRLLKPTSNVGDWQSHDTVRGATADAGYAYLLPNSSAAEAFSATAYYRTTATGFTVNAASPSYTYIYLAIRRPNKPPTTGTQVYNAIARTGTGAAATVTGVGFAPDLCIVGNRNTAYGATLYDRLRGALKVLGSKDTNAEYSGTDTVTGFDVMDGVRLGADATYQIVNKSPQTFINHHFKRAPGVFDVVCHVGTGSTTTVAHGLSAIPELIIRKSRTSATGWPVWCSAAANTGNGEAFLNLTDPYYAGDGNFSALPTETSLSGSFASGNYVSYLFATKAGISKVGSYTGNGTSQTINCGFTTGARFVLIKRTDAAGDWNVWDTVRGIVAGNDPHLSLNTTAAEVATDDSIDPDTSGFIVNQLAATNVNVNAASYIFLAFA